MRSMRFTSIALAATTVVAVSFAVAPATASASVSTRSTVAVERQQDASWVVTVTPSPYPTFQSERDRVLRKAVRTGYQVERVGKDQFVMFGVAGLTAVQAVFAGDDAVASIVVVPGA